MHPDIKKDVSKRILMPIQIILEGVCFWPENQTKLKRTVGVITTVNYLFVILAATGYFFKNSEDIVKMTTSFVPIGSSFQVIMKYITLFTKNSKLLKIISRVRNDFWPTYLADKKAQKKIFQRSRRFQIKLVLFLTVWLLTAAQYQTLNLITGKREMPVESEFLFNWRVSPIFELLYLWQFLVIFSATFCLLGFDLLFIALVDICISQIHIINSLLESSNASLSLIQKIYLNCDQIEDNDIIKIKIAIKCISQHGMVIRVRHEMQEVYSWIIFFQFISCITGMCLVSITVTVHPEEVGRMLFASLALFFSLFLYCWTGDQLIAEGLTVGDAAYLSEWHLFQDLKLRSLLIQIIQKAQSELTLLGIGLVELNLLNFLKVVKFSFSFYTLLKAVVIAKEN